MGTVCCLMEYCLAPPPPGIDASPYYTSLPTGMMPTPPASGPPPPPPGTTPSLNPVASIPSAPTSGSVTVSAPASAPLSLSGPAAPPTSSSRPPQTTVVPPVPAAAAPVAAIIPPPPDIQPVIDKLAEYVARNGVKFESSVRAKNDPRFDFLQSWHKYNSYYEFKKHYFMRNKA
ncbi:splicing factor, suppressor of white-apricot homolog isoform X2 [Carassius carassius]|nr:splicing factor, suppressor of white-apricot homolog isoform X2 [Carassius carassius]